MIVRGTGRPEAYRLPDGLRVPSVTTITSHRKAGVEGLLVWANRLGQEGKDHRDERKKAGDAGTLAHAMVENAIHGRDPLDQITLDPSLPDAEKILSQAQTGFKAWEEWSKVMHVEYLTTETPLVSQTFRFGGTPDAVARLDGRIVILDWKTSNAVYADYVIQLAAYQALVNESKGRRSLKKLASAPVANCTLLRFGKEHADYHVHAYPYEVMAIAWKAFVHLRQVYDLDAQLRKVSG